MAIPAILCLLSVMHPTEFGLHARTGTRMELMLIDNLQADCSPALCLLSNGKCKFVICRAQVSSGPPKLSFKGETSAPAPAGVP